MERKMEMEHRLRELSLKDCDGMLEWMHDPQINYLYTDKIKMATRESVERFILDAVKMREAGSTYHYAVVDKRDEYLGTISLKDVDKIRGAEFAISMRRRFHGKGIASWATREILRIAFEDLKLNRVYLNVLSDNEHANRFYVNNRFRYEGESRQCILIGNELKSLKWYAMLAEEFVKNSDADKESESEKV